MELCALKTNFAIAILIACGLSAPSLPITVSATTAWLPIQELKNDDAEQSESEKIEAEQTRLSDQYKLLEEKLFSLHEYEKDSNPIRSKLLRRAFTQSQEKMTTNQMKMIVKLLTKAKLKDAESEQKVVLNQLEALLELLQSEDRGKRVRDEVQRHQEYLKEVERILRIQKGIRGQTEGGVDQNRLSNSQEKVANRTKKLEDQIGENESNNPDEAEPELDSDNSERGSPEGKPSEPKSSDGSEPNKSDTRKSDPTEENKNGGKSSDGNPSDGAPNSGESDGQADPVEQSSKQENPTRKRINAAEDRMRKALEKLAEANRNDAIKEMKQAEREMAAAKKELEEILRQLREEEIERTLAMLEGRFRKMLEREVRLNESTKKLNDVVPEQRATDFEIRSGKLSQEQASIAMEAARALLILREDGSSVAFPATVDEMHQDMQQVASRLASAKVGRITIEIEEDIVDTLNYLVAALVKTQQDMEKMKRRSKVGKGGQPGDKPLVDKLAEIKMLRGLQERIMRRHKRYARFLDDPDDPVGGTDDPELQSALNRLAAKQAQLTEIARDIVNEKNK